MKRLFPFVPLPALLLINMGIGPCVSKPRGSVDDPNICVYAGKTYATGSSFRASDGCNVCGCAAGQVSCTQIGYADGGTDANADMSAQWCYAANGTMIPCAADAGASCSSGGQVYPFGASFSNTYGCNTCTCTANGTVVCTATSCPDGGTPDSRGLSDHGVSVTIGS